MAAAVQDAIMLFGDSITQGSWEDGGFGKRLSHVYARRLDVLNRGLSGYNTDWAIPVFEQCFATQHEQKHAPVVRLLTIWFGANDACIKPSPQHVPLNKFTLNLKHIIQMVQSPSSPYHSPRTKIILITPPPVNTFQRSADLESRNPPLKLDREFDTTKAYAEAVKQVGAEAGVTVVDVWTALWEACEKKEQYLSRYLVDGLHLNKEGYGVMYDALMQAIKAKHSELYYENMPFVFAPWAEIDWQNPRPSLQRRTDL